MAGAWLYLVGAPRNARLAGLDREGGIAVPPRLTIGRVEGSEIVVREPMIGGRKNSVVELVNGTWRYAHMGHSIPTTHNGRLIPPMERAMPIAHGDVLGPMTVGGENRPILFLFLTYQPGRLRSVVLPLVEAAIAETFPDRATAMTGAVRRWFASEPHADFAALRRVLHCALCGRFTRADAIVEVKAVRESPIRFQVIADADVRIGEGAAYSMGLCEPCLADPDATFARALDAQRLRADVWRLLDAAHVEEPARAELERRLSTGQPACERARCWLCGEDGRDALVGGEGRPICVPCLRGASAIRHIRG